MHCTLVQLSPVTGHSSFIYMTLKLLIIIYSFLNRGWVDFRFSKQYPFILSYFFWIVGLVKTSIECNAQSSHNNTAKIFQIHVATWHPLYRVALAAAGAGQSGCRGQDRARRPQLPRGLHLPRPGAASPGAGRRTLRPSPARGHHAVFAFGQGGQGPKAQWRYSTLWYKSLF